MTATIRDGIDERYLPDAIIYSETTLITRNKEDLEEEWLYRSEYDRVYIPVEFLSDTSFCGISSTTIRNGIDLGYHIEWTRPYVDQMETGLLQKPLDEFSWLTAIDEHSSRHSVILHSLDETECIKQEIKILASDSNYPKTPPGGLA